jgi:uncharacterized membrane protein YkoI
MRVAFIGVSFAASTLGRVPFEPEEVEMNRRKLTIVAGLVVAVALALVGATIARATGAFDDGDAQLKGPQADRARAAALRITGGGRANSVERDSENGATYEVQVTRKDGSTVDVRLDGSYRLVVIEGDSETDDQGGDD